MTRDELNPILDAMAREVMPLLTESPSDALAQEIVNAIVDGNAERSCPARIAARVRPSLQSYLPIGINPDVEPAILESYASRLVSALLWPSPHMMDDDEDIMAILRPHTTDDPA